METKELVFSLELNEEKLNNLIEREVKRYINEKIIKKIRQEIRQTVIDEVNIWRNK